jgi:hypothetical protein
VTNLLLLGAMLELALLATGGSLFVGGGAGVGVGTGVVVRVVVTVAVGSLPLLLPGVRSGVLELLRAVLLMLPELGATKLTV